jgi:hypothetical protein
MPRHKYNKSILKEKAEVFKDISGGLEKLTKDPDSPDALKTIAKIRGYENENFYYTLNDSSTHARAHGEEFYHKSKSDLEKYIINNSNKVLDEFDTGKYTTLLLNSQLNKTGDKSYNEFVEAKKALDNINELKEGKGNIQEYIAKNIFTEDEWKQRAHEISEGNEMYMKALAKDYMKRDMKKINEVFIKYQDQMKNFAEIAVRDAKGRKDSTFFLNMASIALNGDDQ